MHHSDATMDGANGKQYSVGKAVPDWDTYLAYWSKQKKEDLPGAIADYLMTVPLTDQQINEVNSYADHFNDVDYIKSLTILLMELPEYQLS